MLMKDFLINKTPVAKKIKSFNECDKKQSYSMRMKSFPCFSIRKLSNQVNNWKDERHPFASLTHSLCWWFSPWFIRWLLVLRPTLPASIPSWNSVWLTHLYMLAAFLLALLCAWPRLLRRHLKIRGVRKSEYHALQWACCYFFPIT